MKRHGSGGVVVGLLLVGLGTLLLLDATDTMEFGDVFATYWPVFLIAWGLLAIRREHGRGVAGYIVLLLGVGFLLENLDVFADDWLAQAWPVAIIVLGLSLVFGALRARRGPPSSASPGRSEAFASGDWLDATAVLSGRRERVTSDAWRGGVAVAVLGGVELDLRGAIPVAEGAHLRTTAFMGGIEVTVPQDWVVEVHGTPLLGGFENTVEAPATREGGPRLFVTGTAIMGGVEIKH